MIERRTEVRTDLPEVTGKILIDEHRAMPCVISDQSPNGLKLTLHSTEDVPDAFVLTFDGTGETLVCDAAWRKADQIGCTADADVSDWRAQWILRGHRAPI